MLLLDMEGGRDVLYCPYGSSASQGIIWLLREQGKTFNILSKTEVVEMIGKHILRRRIKLFGVTIPLWSLLLLTVVASSAVIVVIITKRSTHEITVEAVGLDFISGDVTVTENGVTLLEYDTYEDSALSMSTAFSIENNNPILDMGRDSTFAYALRYGKSPGTRDIWIAPQEPTGTYPQVSSFVMSADGVEFLSYNGVSWTMTEFGIVNGYSANVALSMVTGSGTAPIVMDMDYILGLTTYSTDQGTIDWVNSGLGSPDPSADFTGLSNSDGDLNGWLGASFSDMTVDHVLGDDLGTNYTSISVTGDAIVEYGGDADFKATWDDLEISHANNCESFYLHIVETDEYIYVDNPII